MRADTHHTHRNYLLRSSVFPWTCIFEMEATTSPCLRPIWMFSGRIESSRIFESPWKNHLNIRRILRNNVYPISITKVFQRVRIFLCALEKLRLFHILLYLYKGHSRHKGGWRSSQRGDRRSDSPIAQSNEEQAKRIALVCLVKKERSSHYQTNSCRQGGGWPLDVVTALTVLVQTREGIT